MKKQMNECRPRRKMLVCLPLVAYLLTCTLHAHAWGKKGHALVAEIAFSLLDADTKKAVLSHLAPMTIEDASDFWMDENKRRPPGYDYMKSWHYVNIDKGHQYRPTDQPNVVNALTRATDELQHKSKLSEPQIKMDLLIVFHLTGDLHQPLHVGYGNDRGGNDVHVSYLGHTSNLHKVWDKRYYREPGTHITTGLSCFIQ